jgi:hypothetical protein
MANPEYDAPWQPPGMACAGGDETKKEERKGAKAPSLPNCYLLLSGHQAPAALSRAWMNWFPAWTVWFA